MKIRQFFIIILFMYIYIACAMQEHKVHHHQSRRHSAPELQEITIERVRGAIRVAERQLSDELAERRFIRRKKMALIALATTAVSSAAGILVYIYGSK